MGKTEVDDAEHGIGSIVRIRLRNFLTYSYTEFFPGPRMNMVIGPNGTGKSTVVCAIALGLAGKPEVLGRAKHLEEFIKHGQQHGRIEIELKAAPKNVVIQRRFERGSNGSEWRLDGKKSTESEVKKRIGALNIQVDNLCQFLPQDKVADFAKMDSAALLRATERSANPDLIVQHDRLIEDQKEMKTLSGRLVVMERDLETLKEKNNRIERDVERLNQREVIQNEIEVLGIKKTVAKYEYDVEKFLQAKDLVAQATKRYEDITSELDPLKDEIARVQELCEASSKEELKFRNEANGSFSKLRDINEEAEAKETEQTEISKNIDEVDRKEKSLRKKIQDYKDKVVEIQTSLNQKKEELTRKNMILPDGSIPAVSPAIESLNRKIQESIEHVSKLKGEWTSITNSKNDLATEITRLRAREKSLIDETTQLDSVRHRRLQSLRRANDQLYNAIMWLRDNIEKFSGRVQEPMILDMEVTDPSYARVVESCIPWKFQTSFLFEKKEDFFKFRQENTNRKWRVNFHCANRPLSEHLSGKMPEQVARQFGFDGTLIDLVVANDLILQVLCEELSFHKCPYSKNTLPRNSVNYAESKLPRFVNGTGPRDVIHVVQTAYDHNSTRYQPFKEPQFLISSVDPEQKRVLQEKISQVHYEIQDLTKKAHEYHEKEAALSTKAQVLKNEKNVYEQEKRQLSAMLKDFKGTEMRLETAKSNLSIQENFPSPKENLPIILDQLVQVNRDRAKFGVEMKNCIVKGTAFFRKRTMAVLTKTIHETKLTSLQRQLDNHSDGAKEAERNLTNCKQSCKDFKIRAKGSHEELIASKAKYADDEEKLAVFDEGLEEDDTFENLDMKIHELEARSAAISQVDPGIITLYNNRKKEIERLAAAFEESRGSVEEKTNEMTAAHNKWKSEVEQIVETINVAFSNHFQSIGCCGEVQLKEEENDYSSWGIQIRVKFRDLEELQILTAQRQSGGERSVSTMLYLISLQSLSKSPFRVVDEINQGMDPRNERLVHKLIVQAACEGDTSQYFLITPKLLPDLEYHEKMRVLCVFNGVWQPQRWDIVRKEPSGEAHQSKRQKRMVEAN